MPLSESTHQAIHAALSAKPRRTWQVWRHEKNLHVTEPSADCRVVRWVRSARRAGRWDEELGRRTGKDVVTAHWALRLVPLRCAQATGVVPWTSHHARRTLIGTSAHRLAARSAAAWSHCCPATRARSARSERNSSIPEHRNRAGWLIGCAIPSREPAPSLDIGCDAHPPSRSRR